MYDILLLCQCLGGRRLWCVSGRCWGSGGGTSMGQYLIRYLIFDLRNNHGLILIISINIQFEEPYWVNIWMNVWFKGQYLATNFISNLRSPHVSLLNIQFNTWFEEPYIQFLVVKWSKIFFKIIWNVSKERGARGRLRAAHVQSKNTFYE